MKDIIVENIKWQRSDMQPGIAALPMEPCEELPQFLVISGPENMSKERRADYVIQYLEMHYRFKVYSFSIPETI